MENQEREINANAVASQGRSKPCSVGQPQPCSPPDIDPQTRVNPSALQQTETQSRSYTGYYLIS